MSEKLETMDVSYLPVPDIRDDNILEYSFKQAHRREHSRRPPKLRPAHFNRFSPSSSFTSNVCIISFRNDGHVEKSEMPLNTSYDRSLNETYFEQCFKNMEKIGEGSFGEVFKVRSIDDGMLYAVKMSKQYMRSEHYRQERLQEVRRYEEFSGHANCVRFYRAWEQDDRLYMQMELYRENLDKYLERERNIPEKKIWSILLDILLALEGLHSRNLIHLDIKLENVLIADDGTCKLGDFGLVVDINAVDRACEGDSRYMAPEILQGNFSKAADIFSLGIAILELSCCLELPCNGPLWQQLRKGILPEAFIKSKSIELQTIIKQMMAPDPSARPTVQDLLAHKKLVLLLRRRKRWNLLKKMQRSLRKTRRFAWSKICKGHRCLRTMMSRMVTTFKINRFRKIQISRSKINKSRNNNNSIRKSIVRNEIITSTPTPKDRNRMDGILIEPKLEGFHDQTPPSFIEKEVTNTSHLHRGHQNFRSRKDLTKTIFESVDKLNDSESKTNSSLDQLCDGESDANTSILRKSLGNSSLQRRQLFTFSDDDLEEI